MRKSLIILIALLLVASWAFAKDKRMTLLKPNSSDAIHVTKKDIGTEEFNRLLGPVVTHRTMGIIDTLITPLANASNFGAQPGDTMAAFFRPPAACFIKSIGILSQSWNDQFADGYNLFIKKAAVDPATFDPDSVNASGWMGVWENGTWVPGWGGTGVPPLGATMWGDFPVTAVDGEWVWTPMIWLGYEPDSEGEPFMVGYEPFGSGDAYIGTQAGDAIDPAYVDWRCWKYYAVGHEGTSGNYGWHWRQYSWRWYVEVEYYENTAPAITYERYGSTLDTGDRTLECTITDADANDPGQAGVAAAKLFYSINGGAFAETPLTLVSGTDTDGMWSAVVPGPRNYGDVVDYHFWAQDKGGKDATSIEGAYSVFQKEKDILVFLNDDASGPGYLAYYFYDVDYPYDLWYGPTDGPISTQLVNMYDFIVQIDQESPITDVAVTDPVIGAWLTGTRKANSTKGYILSSQEWAYNFSGGDPIDFEPGDWHYDFLGIDQLVHDIQPYYQDPHPMLAVSGDPITGEMADWFATPPHDTLVLMHDPYLEGIGSNWNDGIVAWSPNSTPIMYSAAAVDTPMAIRTENGTVKTVFFAYDLISMEGGGEVGYPGTDYHWIMADPLVSDDPVAGGNLLGKSLDWIGAPTAVEPPGGPVPVKYTLEQNYPNPFNPTTTIDFAIEKPGNVKVTVFNMLGQEVAKLTDKHYQAGSHTLAWDASNMASGLYFYKIVAGDFSMTKKMTLLR